MASLTLFIEKHVALAITTQLRREGVELRRAEEVGLTHASDDEIYAYAIANRLTIVTGDRDFLAIVSAEQKANRAHYGVIYISPELRAQGDAAIGRIVKEILFLHEAVLEGAATLEKDIYNQVLWIT